jgi:hypothetical protein
MTTGGNRRVSPGTQIPRPRGALDAHRAALPRVRPAGWWFDIVLVAIFVAITIPLIFNDSHILAVDTAALHWSDNHRNALSWWTGYALSCLGQGGPLTYGTLAIAVFLAWRRRSIRPVFVPATAFLLTYLVIGPIKVWSNRAVPHHGPVEMFAHPSGPYSMAYPSGHTGNAIVWYGALMLLIGPYLPRLIYWLVRFGAPATVAVTMVYIDYHWLTDVVAAIPLGLFLSRVLYRIPFDTIPLPPWRRRSDQASGVESEEPRRTLPALVPASWAQLPTGRRPGPLARIWSTTRPAGPPVRSDTPVQRRPGGAGRTGRHPHSRSGSVRVRDDHD